MDEHETKLFTGGIYNCSHSKEKLACYMRRLMRYSYYKNLRLLSVFGKKLPPQIKFAISSSITPAFAFVPLPLIRFHSLPHSGLRPSSRQVFPEMCTGVSFSTSACNSLRLQIKRARLRLHLSVPPPFMHALLFPSPLFAQTHFLTHPLVPGF